MPAARAKAISAAVSPTMRKSDGASPSKSGRTRRWKTSGSGLTGTPGSAARTALVLSMKVEAGEGGLERGAPLVAEHDDLAAVLVQGRDRLANAVEQAGHLAVDVADRARDSGSRSRRCRRRARAGDRRGDGGFQRHAAADGGVDPCFGAVSPRSARVRVRQATRRGPGGSEGAVVIEEVDGEAGAWGRASIPPACRCPTAARAGVTWVAGRRTPSGLSRRGRRARGARGAPAPRSTGWRSAGRRAASG